MGLSNELVLGNLNAYRDWGHAKDYIKGMWLMLQQDAPKDYVLATGITHSVNELIDYVFTKLDLDRDKYVKSDKKFERAEELHFLKGDSTKAQSELGWKIEYSFEMMLDEMIEWWMEVLAQKRVILWGEY